MINNRPQLGISVFVLDKRGTSGTGTDGNGSWKVDVVYVCVVLEYFCQFNCFMLFEFYFFLRNMILFGNLVMVIELYIAR